MNIPAVRGAFSRPAERLSHLGHPKHIELENVPRTAKPSDIRRAINRAGLQGVSHVALDYERFYPTGRALITLAAPDFLRDNLRLLDRFTIAGEPVFAQPKIVEEIRQRMRGAQGRADAARRGLVTGNGPHADNLQNVGKMAVICGFPGKFGPDVVAPYLSDFRVVRSKKDVPRIEKVPLPKDGFSMYSRFVVTLESVSEAHRLVRHFHLTHFDSEAFGTKYRLYARVVY